MIMITKQLWLLYGYDYCSNGIKLLVDYFGKEHCELNVW